MLGGHNDSQMKNSLMEDANSDQEEAPKLIFQQKSKEMISAKTMLEQRKRALTHHKRM